MNRRLSFRLFPFPTALLAACLLCACGAGESGAGGDGDGGDRDGEWEEYPCEPNPYESSILLEYIVGSPWHMVAIRVYMNYNYRVASSSEEGDIYHREFSGVLTQSEVDDMANHLRPVVVGTRCVGFPDDDCNDESGGHFHFTDGGVRNSLKFSDCMGYSDEIHLLRGYFHDFINAKIESMLTLKHFDDACDPDTDKCDVALECLPIDSDDSRICTKDCTGDCPAGSECPGIDQYGYICLTPERLHTRGFADACNASYQCPVGGICEFTPSISGAICTQACSTDQPCPQDWVCATIIRYPEEVSVCDREQ